MKKLNLFLTGSLIILVTFCVSEYQKEVILVESIKDNIANTDSWNLYKGEIYIEFNNEDIIIGLITKKGNESKILKKYFALQTEESYKGSNKNIHFTEAKILYGNRSLIVISANKAYGFFLKSDDKQLIDVLPKVTVLGKSAIKENAVLQSYFGYGLARKKMSTETALTYSQISSILANNGGIMKAILGTHTKQFYGPKKLCEAGGEGSPSCSYGCGETDCSTDCGEDYYACCGCDETSPAGAYCVCQEY